MKRKNPSSQLQGEEKGEAEATDERERKNPRIEICGDTSAQDFQRLFEKLDGEMNTMTKFNEEQVKKLERQVNAQKLITTFIKMKQQIWAQIQPHWKLEWKQKVAEMIQGMSFEIKEFEEFEEFEEVVFNRAHLYFSNTHKTTINYQLYPNTCAHLLLRTDAAYAVNGVSDEKDVNAPKTTSVNFARSIYLDDKDHHCTKLARGIDLYDFGHYRETGDGIHWLLKDDFFLKLRQVLGQEMIPFNVWWNVARAIIKPFYQIGDIPNSLPTSRIEDNVVYLHLQHYNPALFLGQYSTLIPGKWLPAMIVSLTGFHHWQNGGNISAPQLFKIISPPLERLFFGRAINILFRHNLCKRDAALRLKLTLTRGSAGNTHNVHFDSINNIYIGCSSRPKYEFKSSPSDTRTYYNTKGEVPSIDDLTFDKYDDEKSDYVSDEDEDEERSDTDSDDDDKETDEDDEKTDNKSETEKDDGFTKYSDLLLTGYPVKSEDSLAVDAGDNPKYLAESYKPEKKYESLSANFTIVELRELLSWKMHILLDNQKMFHTIGNNFPSFDDDFSDLGNIKGELSQLNFPSAAAAYQSILRELSTTLITESSSTHSSSSSTSMPTAVIEIVGHYLPFVPLFK